MYIIYLFLYFYIYIFFHMVYKYNKHKYQNQSSFVYIYIYTYIIYIHIYNCTIVNYYKLNILIVFKYKQYKIHKNIINSINILLRCVYYMITLLIVDIITTYKY